MSATMPAPGDTILAPPDFPVTWEDAADAQLLWEHDRVHFPRQMNPLDADVIAVTIGHGFSAAAGAYEMPVVAMKTRLIQGWLFQAIVPFMGAPEEMEARGAAAERNLMALVRDLDGTWQNAWLPELREHLAAFEAFDLQGASDAELATQLDDIWARTRRLWELHFRIVFPAYIAVSEFDEFCRDLFEGSSQLDSYRLLGGRPNKTVEGGQALWHLSRTAGPVVRDVLGRTAAADVPAALAASSEGRAFLAQLEAYLQTHGKRGDLWGIGYTSWIEDPAPAIKTLKDFMTRPDAEAPDVITECAAQEAEQAIAEARARLADYPAPVRERFEGMLAAARVGIVLTEDHGYYIDFQGLYHLRQAVLEVGRRLVDAGTLASAGDVMMLRQAEVAAAIMDPGAADLAAVVAERREQMTLGAAVHPPPLLGTMPPHEPPDNPITRVLAKLFGRPPGPAQQPNELPGAPGSSGYARGRARVVRSLEEAAALQPGEILVTETTAPPWTPLFATAAAVVTDTGGSLSHCAVVAREYGIPAVVGTMMATAMIANGQDVEVDGDAGIVRLV